MKRVISLVLALMLVLSLACTAFAAVSPHNCNEHLNGDCVCDKCGAIVHLVDANCKCYVCGQTVHAYGNDGKCAACGAVRPVYALIVDGNPKTGDIIMTWVAVMGLAAAALFVVTKSYRKAR